MPRKQHLVHLSRADRRTLTRLVRTGHGAAWSLGRARLLLLADAAVAAAVGVSARTRAAWAAAGLGCLTRKPQARPSVPPKLSPAQTLEIAALACTDPPPGYARWSLRLLTQRVIELGIVDTICVETVRRACRKGGSRPGARSAS
jgi:hypothetical protein